MTAQDREDFISMKIKVDNIEIDVKETKETVNEFNNTMTKIKHKLFNDDDTGEEGYFALTKKHGLRLSKLENIKVAFLIIYGGLASFFGWVAYSILKG